MLTLIRRGAPFAEMWVGSTLDEDVVLLHVRHRSGLNVILHTNHTYGGGLAPMADAREVAATGLASLVEAVVMAPNNEVELNVSVTPTDAEVFIENVSLKENSSDDDVCVRVVFRVLV